MTLKFSHKILLAAATVVIVAFALFTVYNDYLQRKTIDQNLEASVSQAGELTATSIQHWLSGRVLLLENLQQDVAAQGVHSNLGTLVGQSSLTSTFQFTYVGDDNGVFTQRPDVPMPAGYDPRKRPWYSSTVDANKTILSAPYLASVGGLVVTVASPIRENGKVVGVAGGDLSLDTLVQMINSVDFGGIGYAFLVSADGQVIVSPDKDQVMKNLKDIYPGAPLSLERPLREVNLGGAQRLLSFTPVEGLPNAKWYIGLSIDADKAYAPLRQFRSSAVPRW